jgi:hypothetical protein
VAGLVGLRLNFKNNLQTMGRVGERNNSSSSNTSIEILTTFRAKLINAAPMYSWTHIENVMFLAMSGSLANIA